MTSTQNNVVNLIKEDLKSSFQDRWFPTIRQESFCKGQNRVDLVYPFRKLEGKFSLFWDNYSNSESFFFLWMTWLFWGHKAILIGWDSRFPGKLCPKASSLHPGVLNDGNCGGEVWGMKHLAFKEPSVEYTHINTRRFLWIFHRNSRKPIGNNEPFLECNLCPLHTKDELHQQIVAYCRSIPGVILLICKS